MVAPIYANNTSAIVVGGGTDAPSSGAVESFTVSSVTGYPTTLTTGDYFHIADPVLTTEKMRVTAITGSSPYTWTTVRGDEGTVPVAHNLGFTVYQVATAGDLMQGPVDWFNVKDPIYGATGNGSTDDTAAIKAAISAATAAAGGTIYFPQGTYKISSSLPCGGNYPNGGLQFIGAGYSSELVLANSANCYIFDMGNATGGPVFTVGAKFADLYLNCNGANQATSSTNGGGIYARGSNWGVYEHLWIEQPWEAGIRFYQDGLGNYGHHNTIIGCLFRDGANASAHGQGWAVKLEQCDENTLVGNTFQNNCQPLSQGHDAQVYDTSAGLQSIVGNHFVGGGTGATMIKSDSSPSRCQIVANQFDGPYNATCVEIGGNAAVIADNIFLNVAQAETGLLAGVTIDAVSGVKVIGNSFSNYSVTNATCVIAQAGASQIHMVDNDVVGTWTVATLFTAPSTSASIIQHNTGYNPVGLLASPAVPGSTTSLVNPFNVDASVFINGGTCSVIKIGSGTTGLTTSSSVNAQIWLPAAQSVTLTYSSAPTWTWIGN